MNEEDDLPLPPEDGAGFFLDAPSADQPQSPQDIDNTAPADAAKQAGEGTPYRVLARKYRPQTFDDLIGQESLVRILRRAFAVGRVAHAFMLTGVRGVGKTTTARIIARALNCTGVDGQGGPTADPCGVCPNCRAILADRHPDVLEMDAASRTGVDDVREIIEASRFRPMQARMKVFVIDEVHMLSRNAFNALLKTLEEPPAQVTFIFATTELRKVPVTVLSRCQRFDLQRVPQSMLAGHFARIARKEGAELEEGALALIARAADGSVRDGLSLLDQAIAQGASDTASVADMLGLADRGMVFDLLEAALHGQVVTVLEIAGRAYGRGADLGVLLTDLMDVLHLLSRIKALPALREGVELPEMERERGGAIVDHVGASVLGRAWQLLLKGLAEVEMAPDRRQAAEMVLIRLCHASMLPTPDRLIRQLQGDSAGPAASPDNGGQAGSASAGGRISIPVQGGEASAEALPGHEGSSAAGMSREQARSEVASVSSGAGPGEGRGRQTAPASQPSRMSGDVPSLSDGGASGPAGHGGIPSMAPEAPPSARAGDGQAGGRQAPATGPSNRGTPQDHGPLQRGSTVLKAQQAAELEPSSTPPRPLRLATENGAPVPASKEREGGSSKAAGKAGAATSRSGSGQGQESRRQDSGVEGSSAGGADSGPETGAEISQDGSLSSGPDADGDADISSGVSSFIPPMPRSWREVVALVRQQREARLHGVLRHLGHLVEFAPPRLVLRIAETDITQRRQAFRRLVDLLDRLYPGRWQVIPSEEAGEPTLDEQGAEIIALHQDKARQHPLVQAILRHFPKAEIGEVRDPDLDDYGLPPEEPVVALGEDVPPDFEFAPDDADFLDEDDFY